MVLSMTWTSVRRVSLGRTRGQIRRTTAALRRFPDPTTLQTTKTLHLCLLQANAVSSSLVMRRSLPPAAAILTHLAFLLPSDFSKRGAPRKWLLTLRPAQATRIVGPVSHSANSLLLKWDHPQCPHSLSHSDYPRLS